MCKYNRRFNTLHNTLPEYKIDNIYFSIIFFSYCHLLTKTKEASIPNVRDFEFTKSDIIYFKSATSISPMYK